MPERGGAVFARVPRILHQTWKSESIPERWQPYRVSWMRHHPEWRHQLWTDEDNRRLIAERYPWFLRTYDAFPRDIQRVDAAKYFILYTHGGVYADLDCECLRPIDPLVARGGAIVSRTRDRVVDCAVLASPAGHRFWWTVFEELQRPTRLARLLRHVPAIRPSHVLFTTGTRMMKRAVRRYLAEMGPDAHGLTVYDARFFSGRSWLDRFEPFDEPEAFVIHHYADSWLLPAEERVHAWFTRRRAAGVLLSLAAAAGLVAFAWQS